MIKRALTRFPRRLRKRIRDAHPKVLLGAGTLLAAALVGGGVSAVRTYDYVQHDNDFCTSCHLMEDPFQRFSGSVHRALSCKACHQPGLVQRARMGLRQIVVGPEEIGDHAEVPDSRCTSCHVDGEAAEWILIRNSRGHEIHLESRHPALDGLDCVSCHSSAVHDFHTSIQSCGQRGCHMQAEIRLAVEGHAELECEVCHDFRAPLDARAVGRDPASLLPAANQCLSCHEMREMTKIDPDEEPHGGRCGLCHDAHSQRTAGEALASCSQSLCHPVPESIDADHHRIGSVRLADCGGCHEAHTFRVDGERCGSCHSDIVSERPSQTARTPSPPRPLVPPTVHASWEPGADVSVGGPSVPSVEFGSPGRSDEFPSASQVPPSSDTVVFAHERHRSVACRSCHPDGTSVVREDPAWCDGCHHGDRPTTGCARCHDEGPGGEAVYPSPMTLPGGVRERDLVFPHARHSDRECTECHGNPPGPVGREFSCTTCHEEHHGAEEVACLQCHSAPPPWAHEAVVVHRTCSGGICHQRFPEKAPAEWERPVCLACHPEFEDGELPELPTSVVDTLRLSGKPPRGAPGLFRPRASGESLMRPASVGP